MHIITIICFAVLWLSGCNNSARSNGPTIIEDEFCWNDRMYMIRVVEYMDSIELVYTKGLFIIYDKHGELTWMRGEGIQDGWLIPIGAPGKALNLVMKVQIDGDRIHVNEVPNREEYSKY